MEDEAHEAPHDCRIVEPAVARQQGPHGRVVPGEHHNV
jgi:hypothetical protein